jgi:hypothetical protein
MEITGLSVNAQTNVKSADVQAKQQAYAKPTSQTQSGQKAEKSAKTTDISSRNDAVRVTITNEGKDKLNISQQQNGQNGGGATNAGKLENLAQGNNTQSGKNAREKNTAASGSPPENPVFSNSAYFAIEKSGQDNKQAVVVKIVDSNGNVVRQIPPGDFFKNASELNIIPNELYHTLA